MRAVLVALTAAFLGSSGTVVAQLRQVAGSAGSANGLVSPPGIPLGSPGKTGDHIQHHGLAKMTGHGHTVGDGPEKRTEVKAEAHHERMHAGGKPQSHHDELHAKARDEAKKNMALHGEAHLDEDHQPLPPGRVDTEVMHQLPNTVSRTKGPLRLGPENHTGFGHIEYDPPMHIDPHSDIHDDHLTHHGFTFDERDPRRHPKHEEHDDWRQEQEDKHHAHRQKLREYKKKHGIKSKHPRRNRSKKEKEEHLGYWGAQRENEGTPHPSEKYDYLHWEIEELRHEHDDAVHLYGMNSEEAREIELLMKQLRSVDKAVDYLDWGMSQEEFDQMIEWLNEMHEVNEKHKNLGTDFDEGKHLLHDPEAHAEAMHLHSEELHRLEERKMELEILVREAKQHHHMLYKPWENEGTIAERVKLRELYEKVHNTHDRAERLKLRTEYNERMETIADRRRYHGMPEEEKAMVQEIREQIHNSHDEHEKGELRHQIEEIYSTHRERKKEAGHMDDVHRPDLGHHRLEYNDMLHESDEELLSYHDQLRKAKSADEQRKLRIKIRDRVHELHHDGVKHPNHGTHA